MITDDIVFNFWLGKCFHNTYFSNSSQDAFLIFTEICQPCPIMTNLQTCNIQVQVKLKTSGGLGRTYRMWSDSVLRGHYNRFFSSACWWTSCWFHLPAKTYFRWQTWHFNNDWILMLKLIIKSRLTTRNYNSLVCSFWRA